MRSRVHGVATDPHGCTDPPATVGPSGHDLVLSSRARERKARQLAPELAGTQPARRPRIARLASIACVVVVALAASASARAQSTGEPSRRVVRHVPGESIVVELREGDELHAATCGTADATHEGDTTLALVGPTGARVSFNDDACLSLGSVLRFVVPPGHGGSYVLQPGCYASRTCSGALVIEVGPAPPSERVRPVRIAASARGVIGVEGEHGALVGDLLVESRLVGPLLLRFGGSPAGIGGGDRGGLAGGSLTLTLGFDAQVFALAAGPGVSVLATRIGGQAAQETPAFVTFVRIGRQSLFHFEAQLAVWMFGDTLEVLSFQGLARLPLGAIELFARGAGGHDGIALGELGLVVWAGGEQDRTFGISLHVGGAGVFHQPLCRFDVPCRDTRWIVGPSLGVGFEWSP